MIFLKNIYGGTCMKMDTLLSTGQNPYAQGDDLPENSKPERDVPGTHAPTPRACQGTRVFAEHRQHCNALAIITQEETARELGLALLEGCLRSETLERPWKGQFDYWTRNKVKPDFQACAAEDSEPCR